MNAQPVNNNPFGAKKKGGLPHLQKRIYPGVSMNYLNSFNRVIDFTLYRWMTKAFRPRSWKTKTKWYCNLIKINRWTNYGRIRTLHPKAWAIHLEQVRINKCRTIDIMHMANKNFKVCPSNNRCKHQRDIAWISMNKISFSNMEEINTKIRDNIKDNNIHSIMDKNNKLTWLRIWVCKNNRVQERRKRGWIMELFQGQSICLIRPILDMVFLRSMKVYLPL